MINCVLDMYNAYLFFINNVFVFVDQVAATEEKSILEEIQRSDARERKAKCEEWVPKYFRQVHCSYFTCAFAQ